ncbi:PREDICTED: uncharacterized protein LOC100638682 [Amphimedon queenslandica]|uniref:SH2 domain-containing protein n=1 Tax=Amphimedon queenslandica TaxID=400682 RepID=A0A1X7UTY0_AMPQE|nr:PREDICTED: uncharacterized protein LOC100638682 [Amphimedon queenslandica]|eukprot:XP_019852537.1 PREDICTED: uncharacterized protein LOC100638682 [Amphimedon queenslandica]
MSGGLSLDGLYYGKLPVVGKRDWLLYYIEVSEKHFHIFEGNENPSRSRKHLQSLEIHSSDRTGAEGKDKKNDFKFYYDRGSGGKYIFKCQKQDKRQLWISTLEKLIQKRDYYERGILREENDFSTSLPTSPSLTAVEVPQPPPRSTTLPGSHPHHIQTTPPPPPHSNRHHKRDSGFVSGTGVVSQGGGYRGGCSADGEICHMKSNSGDSSVVHNTAVKLTKQSNSADGSFMHGQSSQSIDEEEDDLSRYDWYWGPMSRDECERSLKEKGQIGNFVVRKNDRGSYIMSFWRKDGVHHHKIAKCGPLYKFEKSAVNADGMGIPDLLDTYMKHCTDKTIGPYGGELYPTYDQAWNPPEIDFNKFGSVLNQQMQATGAKRLFKPGLEMDGNTYGGMSLKQIKDVIDKTEASSNESFILPSAVKTPFPAPVPIVKHPIVPTTSKQPVMPPTNKTGPPTKHKPLPAPPKKPPPGYVNLLPTNLPPANSGGHNRTPSTDYNSEEEEYDDDDQEVYIAPGEIEDEHPIYENHGPTGSSLQPNSPYANVSYDNNGGGGAPGAGGLYQNVTYDGKPHTPPRQIKPSPSPSRPRRK